ncbi:MAG: hypothetical protein AUJ92_08445 [Armatimonadetes bacterium CG2_30_59_28]|nr:LamG domain-containing protein [Armatimonadota bacterium]OIO95150.1 MAG: hypothetical protein AUJ92_08445 [Armatimonadetes bacterium CG2_30_59_28]PIU61840.1 MAG: hypothetical protein COS85_20155 [Armatimonadetes bacterium CG07_land_8_20_14_0_80_59_28]PIY46703.1 MAG: hypothetical protein COZ05_05615 [Armatimonadetes bacterium CG_4_10_14_3_um_filter_59_10]PJB68442.1 MAG: hypothetical protein CO095_11200 [Armatimonadetes bacterium CG_4_9_14_3_um_filter_58_7]
MNSVQFSVISRLGKLLLLGWIVFFTVPSWGEESDRLRMTGDVLFHCSFDGTITPEVHKGEIGSTTATAAEYTKGIKGKALVTSHSKGISFPTKSNISVAQGTIKFWGMPMDWQAGDGLFHHFFRILDQKPEGAKDARAFDLILYKFCEWDSVVAFGMCGELTSSNLLQIPMDNLWAPKKWHQIVFTWDKHGACLYVDGKGKRQNYLRGAPDSLFSESFIVGGPYFVENKTSTAIDELTIYTSKLSAQEVEDIYKTELIESVMQR